MSERTETMRDAVERRPEPPRRAIGPDGRPLTLEDLPSPETKRWVSRRKAEVVAGVRAGLLTVDEALRRYRLTMEEFLSWQRLVDRHGVAGLRATRLQDYRSPTDQDTTASH